MFSMFGRTRFPTKTGYREHYVFIGLSIQETGDDEFQVIEHTASECTGPHQIEIER